MTHPVNKVAYGPHGSDEHGGPTAAHDPAIRVSGLDAIRARHRPINISPWSGVQFCLGDSQPWPCDVATLLAELERARAALRRLPRFGVVGGIVTPHSKGTMVRLDDALSVIADRSK